MPRTYNIPIPSASQDAFWARDKNKPQNPGLVFDRFSPNWGADSTLKRDDSAPTLKRDGLEIVREASEHIDRDLFSSWVRRWQQDADSIHAKAFERVSDWRFVAGLGRKGSLETGFTFNRYGFPYLPGSSIKGLARMCALVEVAEELHTDQLNELDDVLSTDTNENFKKAWLKVFHEHPEIPALALSFRLVFGTTDQTGCAVFLDAIPSSPPRLELDIMNPHYPDYYQGKEPPTNWQSPQPITFLTVAARTPFLFAVGWRHGAADNTDVFKKAVHWLQTGLENLGAGAKTSAGYGYFVEAANESDASIQDVTTKNTTPRSLPMGYERGVVRVGIDSGQSAGWITRSNGADIFVHRSCLADGRTHLDKGQRVTFKEGLGPNGKKQAQDVRPE